MKPCTLLVLLVISTFFACYQSSNNLDEEPLKLTMVEGYGPFSPGFGSLTEGQEDDAEWGKIYQPLKGIPARWQKVSKSMVWLDAHQLVYKTERTESVTIIYFGTS